MAGAIYELSTLYACTRYLIKTFMMHSFLNINLTFFNYIPVRYYSPGPIWAYLYRCTLTLHFVFVLIQLKNALPLKPVVF